jgi:hypothetical protein
MARMRQSGSAEPCGWSIRLFIASVLARSRRWIPAVRRLAIGAEG